MSLQKHEKVQLKIVSCQLKAREPKKNLAEQTNQTRYKSGYIDRLCSGAQSEIERRISTNMQWQKSALCTQVEICVLIRLFIVMCKYFVHIDTVHKLDTCSYSLQIGTYMYAIGKKNNSKYILILNFYQPLERNQKIIITYTIIYYFIFHNVLLYQINLEIIYEQLDRESTNIKRDGHVLKVLESRLV